MPKRMYRPFVLVLVALLCLGASAPSPLSTEKRARQFILGAWTYTGKGSEMDYLYSNSWVRWVFHANGMLEMFAASPTDKNWGKGQKVRYTFALRKYRDSTVPYIFIRVRRPDMAAQITEDGVLEYSFGGFPSRRLMRGDAFPFSK